MTVVDVDQVLLPGQAAAPEGPIQMIGMYVMHHAFRRDLDMFIRLVPTTPVADRANWRALAERWEWFSFVLHHHHTAEDEGLWPPLLERVDAAGDAAGRAVLEAMEAEHAEIDPLLRSCAAGFQRLADRGDTDERAGLEVRLIAARHTLGQHLSHEERDAIPLIQRHIDPALWEALEKKHFSAGYTLRQTLRVLGWTMYQVPRDDQDVLFSQPGGGLFRPIYRWVIAPRYQRRERLLDPTGGRQGPTGRPATGGDPQV